MLNSILPRRRCCSILWLFSVAAFTLIHQGCSPPAEVSLTTAPASPIVPADVNPTYAIHPHPRAQLHVVTVPDPNAFPLQVVVTEPMQLVKSVAIEAGAIAAINAGFFDPNNGQTTSYVIQDGTVVADPQRNRRLIDNPDLASYLDRILNRSELRCYRCDDRLSYAITARLSPVPSGCRLEFAVGAGPQLLPENTAQQEAFIDYDADGHLTRDALGSQSPNARSAVGIRADGVILLVMAAQSSLQAPTGLTLTEMTQFMQQLGAEQALNLDGGSSATLFFDGQSHYGRLNEQGSIRRPVKSTLLVNKTQ